jgi:hypothetical protein
MKAQCKETRIPGNPEIQEFPGIPGILGSRRAALLELNCAPLTPFFEKKPPKNAAGAVAHHAALAPPNRPLRYHCCTRDTHP